MLEQSRVSPNREIALGLCFIAFSSREPVPTSLENALGAQLEGRHSGAGEFVGALVLGVAGMALDPDPFDFM